MYEVPEAPLPVAVAPALPPTPPAPAGQPLQRLLTVMRDALGLPMREDTPERSAKGLVFVATYSSREPIPQPRSALGAFAHVLHSTPDTGEVTGFEPDMPIRVGLFSSEKRQRQSSEPSEGDNPPIDRVLIKFGPPSNQAEPGSPKHWLSEALYEATPDGGWRLGQAGFSQWQYVQSDFGGVSGVAMGEAIAEAGSGYDPFPSFIVTPKEGGLLDVALIAPNKGGALVPRLKEAWSREMTSETWTREHEPQIDGALPALALDQLAFRRSDLCNMPRTGVRRSAVSELAVSTDGPDQLASGQSVEIPG